ncbi:MULTISPECIES: SRPBCC family protein [Kitasatospora]|uniref:SRPBCC family protein n=1 Tax=Kitasatospora cathayae TaxID=3004092 RepID=A0ABY7Q0C6_9ACTN|nr:SRPBCC family protein [Kitasatospora sp. HUAS 3-15]WBP86147.1 SRPBCC family protein [Kitasatospora sp. HUAS 3-15]
MDTFSWTLPVVGPGENPVRPNADQVWEGLVHKAENPSPYVPAVTACRVLERFDDGFLREITVRDTERVHERVTFEPGERVVFRPTDDPCIEQIVNELGKDENGHPTLTLRVTLSPAGVEKAEQTRYFLHETKRYFSDALQFIVEGLVERHGR